MLNTGQYVPLNFVIYTVLVYFEQALILHFLVAGTPVVILKYFMEFEDL